MNSIHVRALVNEEGRVEVQLPEQLHGKLLDLVVVYEPVPEGEQEGAAPSTGWPAGLYEATAGAWQGEPLLREPLGEYEERDVTVVRRTGAGWSERHG